MQSNQTPTLVPLPFAANGTKNTIPEASQIGITPGAASLNDGFPPLTFTPIAAGGIPPAGADFNGVLNLITQSIRWAHAGGRYAFSSTFSADANVGGYPAGAVLMSADQQGSWLSLNDNNTDNPDTGAGTKWVPSHAYGVTAVTGLASSNVTLTPAQAMKSKITLAGTLTANVQIIFPTWTRDWTIVNNTTGAFTVTAKTASGTGVALAAGQQKITGDGTNIVQPAESIASATQSGHAVQLGQVTSMSSPLQLTTQSATQANQAIPLSQVQSLLTNMLVITSSQGVTVPANVTKMKYRAVGPGAGGGGSNAANSAAGGAGSGSYSEGVLAVTPGATLTVTIGAPGTQGTTGNGNAGGTTTITGTGISVSVFSGLPSPGASAGVPIGGQGNGAPVSTTSGANVLAALNVPGTPGQAAFYGSGSGYFSGNGASSVFGGPLPGGSGYPGAGAGAYGAGGSGGANNNFGGNGSPSVVIFEW
ncbi:hypothetical protein [Burkholderia ubonensis]|uniref:glycine-rich domain-containing protein n=1 Tax=Burkholderia ubonensis TaxID=101571 RepID=UPI000A99E581|nr:hypothetical protein [Burkholderia ubonensis]